MPILITSALRGWLHDHGLVGYIKVAEAPPHPNALEMATKINVDTITSATIRKKLGLSNMGERYFNIFPNEVLERYFGEHSLSAKAYRTWDTPDPFF